MTDELPELNEKLKELDALIYSPEACTEGCEHGDEEEDLEEAERGDLEEGLDAVGHVGELDVATELDVAERADVAGHAVADDGDHRDAAVLLLDLAVPVELLLGDAVGDADGVPVARGRLRAERLGRVERAGRLGAGLLRAAEAEARGGGEEERQEDSARHF